MVRQQARRHGGERLSCHRPYFQIRAERSGSGCALSIGDHRLPCSHLLERLSSIVFPLFSPRLVFELWRQVKRADVVHIHDVFYMSSWAPPCWPSWPRRPDTTDPTRGNGGPPQQTGHGRAEAGVRDHRAMDLFQGASHLWFTTKMFGLSSVPGEYTKLGSCSWLTGSTRRSFARRRRTSVSSFAGVSDFR